MFNKAILKRLKKAGEAAYLCYSLAGPLAGLPMTGEAALGKVAKCHAESMESVKTQRKRQTDVFVFTLGSQATGGK